MYYNGHLSYSISTLLGLFNLLHLTTTIDLDINLNHIMDQYVYLCGRHSVCNKDLLTTPSYKERGRINISCPVCSCQDKCRIQGDCCPDFSSNTCVQTSFKLEKEDELVEYFMKNDCPQDADENLVRRCQETNTDENLLRRYPVTSTDTNLTYSNVQCARCNQDLSVIPWLIKTDCNVQRISFTNVDEFWISLKTVHCDITYGPPEEINHILPKMCEKNVHLIAKCNATGTVSDFDKHVEEACKTTNLPIGAFKNPFCILCNIEEKSFDPPISTCNVTGKLKYIEERIVNECLNKSVDLLTYPYKNEYCKECNLPKTDEGDFKYADVNLTIQIYNKFHSLTDINNISKVVYLSKYSIRSFNFWFNSTLSETIEIQQRSQDQININWINRNKWCGRENNFYAAEDNRLQAACSCTADCNKTNICCNDPNEAWTKRLLKTWRCVGTTIPRTSSSENHYFMISKCGDNNNNGIIKRLCESDEDDNYLSFIPVTDIQSLFTYKNYFCFLCVSPNTSRNLIVPWTFSMLCPVIFNFKNEESLKSVINNGLSRNCTFNLVPSSDDYVQDSCRGWGERSLYCSVCYQYKTHSFENLYTGKGYRSIFSLLDYTKETDKKNNDLKCSSDEVFYQDECRKLVCNPRKTLANGICKTMISSYASKTYNVAFRADVHSEIIMKIERNHLIQKMTSFVIEDLSDDSDLDISVLKYYHRINRTCRTIIELSKFNPVSIQAFLMISIRIKPSNKLLDSDMIEYSLYNATSKTRSWGNISINSYKGIQAWFLPISKTEVYSTSFCSDRQYWSDSFDSREPGRDITELLFCPQVLLDADKYTVSSDGLQAFVKSLNRTFYYNEFYQGVNNTLHICARDFTTGLLALTNQEGSPKRSEYPLALQVISIFSTCISLIALCITFIVYCILEKLRTIPGQNLMCFVGSLFFAQLFSLLKDFFHVNNMACVAVGILTYYFWLSVFTTANVCCFHMCRVFVCNARFQNKLLCSPTVVWYMIYSFSVPFLLTIITIGCHVILSPSNLSGFGGYACFTLDRDTQLFAFIIPISVICLVNFLLFSVTFYKIHDAPTMETANSHYCRNDLFIYFKLFLLTGTAWVLQIIDGLFPVSPFSYLVTIFNALQGLYIMISFVLNGRVKNMFRELGMYERFRFLHVAFKSSQSTGSTQLTQRFTSASKHESQV